MEARPIAILPDHVIDQIAAGEVVERPASVVKELVENAIDAGARQITIEVDGGGKRRIRVVDDGSGMTAADARLALARHATSKLRAVDELFGITTMGFRGEALPSIAAVSRLTLSSHARGHAAVRLEVEGGRIVEEGEIGAPPGTQIEVRDLLYNVPARQKFMKGEATEAAQIGQVVDRLALAHPAIHFRLIQRGRTALDAPPHPSALERIKAVLGLRLGERLHLAEGEEAGIRVTAFLAAPEWAQTTMRGLTLFVGRRAVRDRGLGHAVVQGYGELVPRGRYPTAVVFIDAPGPTVDVNVHPQKAEVRFADASLVQATVRHVVRRAVASAPWLGEDAPQGAPVRMEVFAATSPPRDFAAELSRERARALLSARPRSAQVELGWQVATATGRLAESSASYAPAAPGVAPASAEPPTSEGFFRSLRYLGQLDRTYLLCERAGELVILDQHAAHERVAFQRLKARLGERSLPRQQALFPRTTVLDRAQAVVALEAAAELGQIGFELEPLADEAGGQAFAVKAVPAGMRPGDDPLAVLTEVLGELAERGAAAASPTVDRRAVLPADRLDAVLATLACHSVVRAGDPLLPPEVDSLLAAMDEVDFRAHCPHGRPVLLRIRVDEIARRFGR